MLQPQLRVRRHPDRSAAGTQRRDLLFVCGTIKARAHN
jgi:hypothetical protein